MPSTACPCCEASISAEPRNAPTQGVQPTENTTPNKNDEKKLRSPVWAARALPAEQIQPQHAEEVQPEHGHDQPAHDVDGGLPAGQEAAHRPGQRAHRHEQHREAEHEPGRAAQRAPRRALPAAPQNR